MDANECLWNVCGLWRFCGYLPYNQQKQSLNLLLNIIIVVLKAQVDGWGIGEGCPKSVWRCVSPLPFFFSFSFFFPRAAQSERVIHSCPAASSVHSSSPRCWQEILTWGLFALRRVRRERCKSLDGEMECAQECVCVICLRLCVCASSWT